MSANNYTWEFVQEKNEVSKQLARDLKISPVIARLLINRGIDAPESAAVFLNPMLKDLPDPFLMKDMQKSVDRIIRAIRKGEKICIYGDYDVDGVTATALLIRFFREIGVTVEYHIPHRLHEGYGLNIPAIQKITEKMGERKGLIITVDCGITNFKEIEEANKLGVDIIVTDHHQLPDLLPPAWSIINPLQQDCAYPYKSLSGAGLAYKLLIALRATLKKENFFPDDKIPNLKRHLDLVCLSTLADSVPLTGENHILAKFGLKEIENSTKLGINILKEVSGLKNKPIDVYEVAFILVPRLNAPGRMDSGSTSVDLLISEEADSAWKLAEQIDQINRERQKLQEKIFNDVQNKIKESGSDQKQSIVLSSPQWHLGVIGIVAAKVAEGHNCPCILICIDGQGNGKGSARSTATFDLYEGLQKLSPFLSKFGGHKYAAGLSIKASDVPEFSEGFDKLAREKSPDVKPIPNLKIDTHLQLTEITRNLIEEIKKLGPFGTGNPNPLFVLKNARIAGNFIFMGKDSNHIKFHLKTGYSEPIEVVSFNQQITSLWPEPQDPVDLVFSPQINEWNGTSRIQLRLKDIKKSTQTEPLNF